MTEIRCPIPGVEPWASGVLEPGKHDALVRGLDKYTQEAGVPVSYILAPREETLRDPRELEWLDGFRRHRLEGTLGLLYLGGGWSPTVEVRMAGMVGVLTRNYILARMISMGEAQSDLRFKGEVVGTCLCIPNFVDGVPDERKRSLVSDLLIARFKDGRSQTVLAAPSLEVVSQLYGGYVRDHLAQHFTILEGRKERHR